MEIKYLSIQHPLSPRQTKQTALGIHSMLSGFRSNISYILDGAYFESIVHSKMAASLFPTHVTSHQHLLSSPLLSLSLLSPPNLPTCLPTSSSLSSTTAHASASLSTSSCVHPCWIEGSRSTSRSCSKARARDAKNGKIGREERGKRKEREKREAEGLRPRAAGAVCLGLGWMAREWK